MNQVRHFRHGNRVLAVNPADPDLPGQKFERVSALQGINCLQAAIRNHPILLKVFKPDAQTLQDSG